jgi:hypothetical protein
MKSQIRHLVADALYSANAHTLPSICERYGLDSGEDSEAFSGKRRYVIKRLIKFSDERVLHIAKEVVKDFPDEKLQIAIEQLDSDGHLVSDVTRKHLAIAMNGFSIAGDGDLMEMLRKHWPSIDQRMSNEEIFEPLSNDIARHAVFDKDWPNSEVLKQAGFHECSQTRLFIFLEDVVHPVRQVPEAQQQIVESLNPILRRDGYQFAKSTPLSGYPIYKIVEAAATGVQPADELISQTLISFDEDGVHQAWQKALTRRTDDPEGAITAAKTLLETVCKHIVDKAGGSYGDNDDLPKLYHTAAEHLNLAPSQHTEQVFKTILGNCHSVVSNLAGLRNKLGDSHGQGKRYIKPSPRHAELAVNLAGSVATFLISTWNTRKN